MSVSALNSAYSYGEQLALPLNANLTNHAANAMAMALSPGVANDTQPGADAQAANAAAGGVLSATVLSTLAQQLGLSSNGAASNGSSTDSSMPPTLGDIISASLADASNPASESITGGGSGTLSASLSSSLRAFMQALYERLSSQHGGAVSRGAAAYGAVGSQYGGIAGRIDAIAQSTQSGSNGDTTGSAVSSGGDGLQVAFQRLIGDMAQVGATAQTGSTSAAPDGSTANASPDTQRASAALPLTLQSYLRALADELSGRNVSPLGNAVNALA